MKYAFPFLVITALVLFPVLSMGAATPSSDMKQATVFVVKYNSNGNFLGWGSGFFVDEGIVVTNKHVLEGGAIFRVYATGDNEQIDLKCYKTINNSDVRINLDDDVAYMRAYLDCPHGVLDFADDPWDGDSISILGYPYRGSFSSSKTLLVSTGSVTGSTPEGWRKTDAHLDIGNSGGPVVNDAGVVGVAVAKSTDSEGNYVSGYFIQSSVIEKGLLYANNSDFGYVSRPHAVTSRSSTSSLSSSRSFTVIINASSSSSRSSSSSSERLHEAASSRSSFSPRVVFSDVPRTHTAFSAISELFDRGVIGGYADGTFRPRNSINRAEFLKILVGGFASHELRNDKRCFTDVGTEWFSEYVCAAKRLGWVDGYVDNTFKPAQQINRAEAMKILIDAFGAEDLSRGAVPSDVRSGVWYHPYVARGVTLGIVDARTLFKPAENLTRADAAVWIEGAETE